MICPGIRQNAGYHTNCEERGVNEIRKAHNSAWPDWYDGKKINEIQFCYDFLESHPLKCIAGRFYTPDGPVEDEAEIKQKVLLEIESYVTSGLSKAIRAIFMPASSASATAR